MFGKEVTSRRRENSKEMFASILLGGDSPCPSEWIPTIQGLLGHSLPLLVLFGPLQLAMGTAFIMTNSQLHPPTLIVISPWPSFSRLMCCLVFGRLLKRQLIPECFYIVLIFYTTRSRFLCSSLMYSIPLVIGCVVVALWLAFLLCDRYFVSHAV